MYYAEIDAWMLARRLSVGLVGKLVRLYVSSIREGVSCATC
jgi:hypothetical protein